MNQKLNETTLDAVMKAARLVDGLPDDVALDVSEFCAEVLEQAREAIAAEAGEPNVEVFVGLCRALARRRNDCALLAMDAANCGRMPEADCLMATVDACDAAFAAVG